MATYCQSPPGKRCQRVFFPEGCKDACEAAMAEVGLRGWARGWLGEWDCGMWYNLIVEAERWPWPESAKQQPTEAAGQLRPVIKRAVGAAVAVA